MSNDYAMATKARALYSQHLSLRNYASLLDLNSVGDIAGYLKSQTRYSGVLEGVNQDAIHRDYLEQRIRSIAMGEFLSLMTYVQKEKHHFYEFYIKELEINQIIFVLHAIDSASQYHYGKFLNELNHLMAFDVDALMVCKTYDEVLDVLEGTVYRSILSLLLNEEPDLSRAENNLHAHYNDYMLKLISQENDPELESLFSMQLELENIVYIYRMKKYFDMNPEDLRAHIQGPYVHISHKKIKQWLEDYSGDQVLEALQNSYYGRLVDFDGEHHIEYYADYIRFKTLKKALRFSTNTDLTLFAYMGLVSIEIKNIIDVIEGVRYKVSTQEIENLLIY